MCYNYGELVIHPNIKFWRSIGIMIGAIIGVGIFGLPYAFQQSGLMIGLLELGIMAILLIFMQLMFAEVALQTEGRHRLVGLVKIYLGKTWSRVALVVMSAGIWGAMIAYIIVGGTFLHLLLSPIIGGTVAMYSIVIVIISSAFIYQGLRFASKIEVMIVIALLFLFVFIILASLPLVEIDHLATIHPKAFLIPYGVILFSMAGIGIVPEMKDVLGEKQKHRLGQAILISMGVIVLLYALFATVVLGVTGAETTQAAFDGLLPHLGTPARVVASLLGSLTIISIYTILGIELLNTFRLDFRLKHNTSWLLVTIVPVVFYLLGMRELISIIGFVGSVFGGLLGILIILTYLFMKQSPTCRKHKCINFPTTIAWMIIVLFGVGSLLQIYSTLFS